MYHFLFSWIQYFDNTDSNVLTTRSTNSVIWKRFIQRQVSAMIHQNSNFFLCDCN